VATAQAAYAFAPAAFGLLREAAAAAGPAAEGAAVFLAAVAVKCLAISALLIGRTPRAQ
jgi:hypothetical protein